MTLSPGTPLDPLLAVVLAIATVVIVPLGMGLFPGWRVARLAQPAFAVGVAAAIGVALPRGPIAGAAAGLWLAFVVVVALVAVHAWWSTERDLLGLIWPGATVFLVVGAGWLLADRLGLQPGGFTAPVVELTAVHFHYAGFASSVLAGLVRRATSSSHPRATAGMVVAVLAGTPMVAIGFTVNPGAQILGAAILTAGLLVLAWVTLFAVVPTVPTGPAVLLGASAIAVIIPMLLALHWAVGRNVAGVDALSIATMIRTHGVANAFGFVLLGLIGWRWVAEAGPHDPAAVDLRL